NDLSFDPFIIALKKSYNRRCATLNSRTSHGGSFRSLKNRLSPSNCTVTKLVKYLGTSNGPGRRTTALVTRSQDANRSSFDCDTSRQDGPSISHQLSVRSAPARLSSTVGGPGSKYEMPNRESDRLEKPASLL